MALSRVIRVGDGSTKQFVVDFALGYINPSDVTCRVGDEKDGAGNPIYRTITFLSDTLVEISGTVPGNGVQVLFERTVLKTDTLMHFSNGDVLDEENLDIAFKQVMMIVHEALDGRFERFDSDIDHGGFRITGLGDPINASDGANKQYVDSKIATGESSAAAAAASASAAATSAGNAAASAGAAASSATAASGSATTASTKATEAATSASNASTSAGNAAGSASASASSAAAAEASRVAANGSAEYAWARAQEAAGSATAAAGSATAANTSKTDAQTAQIRAYNWAMAAEDVTVNDTVRTGNSAFHHAKKAQASATAADASKTAAANSATAAAASAAAAATFDPANYVSKTSLDGQILSSPVLGVQPTNNNAILELRGSATKQAIIDLSSNGRNRDYDWRVTVDSSTERLNFVYNNDASSFFMNTDGNMWSSSYGWFHDKWADRGAQVNHNSDIVEFSGYDGGISNSVGQCGAPYVMIGLRRGTVGSDSVSYIRALALRNN